MCYTILCYTILYCTVLYYIILYCTVLYYTILYCTIQCYCTILCIYCTILCYTILYYIILNYTALHYCTVLYYNVVRWTCSIFSILECLISFEISVFSKHFIAFVESVLAHSVLLRLSFGQKNQHFSFIVSKAVLSLYHSSLVQFVAYYAYCTVLWSATCFICTNHSEFLDTTLSDFKLPPRCKWGLRSSEMLHSGNLWFFIDVSGKNICPIFKGPAVKHYLTACPLKMQPKCCRGMSVNNTNLRCVTFHKTEYLLVLRSRYSFIGFCRVCL